FSPDGAVVVFVRSNPGSFSNKKGEIETITDKNTVHGIPLPGKNEFEALEHMESGDDEASLLSGDESGSSELDGESGGGAAVSTSSSIGNSEFEALDHMQIDDDEVPLLKAQALQNQKVDGREQLFSISGEVMRERVIQIFLDVFKPDSEYFSCFNRDIMQQFCIGGEYTSKEVLTEAIRLASIQFQPVEAQFFALEGSPWMTDLEKITMHVNRMKQRALEINLRNYQLELEAAVAMRNNEETEEQKSSDVYMNYVEKLLTKPTLPREPYVDVEVGHLSNKINILRAACINDSGSTREELQALQKRELFLIEVLGSEDRKVAKIAELQEVFKAFKAILEEFVEIKNIVLKLQTAQEHLLLLEQAPLMSDTESLRLYKEMLSRDYQLRLKKYKEDLEVVLRIKENSETDEDRQSGAYLEYELSRLSRGQYTFSKIEELQENIQKLEEGGIEDDGATLKELEKLQEKALFLMEGPRTEEEKRVKIEQLHKKIEDFIVRIEGQ
nr:hypothetical protein [bacterium]